VISSKSFVLNHFRVAGALVISISIALVFAAKAEEATESSVSAVSADAAKARLQQGNRRCVEGRSAHKHDLARWRERFLVKQQPFATVLGCSDSRVPPEFVFDQGFGQLFVIRVAGNIVDPAVIASIQYSIEHLENKLIIVLGHQNCGAVTAALASPNQTKNEPKELRNLLDRIRPAITTVDRRSEHEHRVAIAVEANARASAKQLREVPSIAAAIRTKHVKVVAAIDNVATGTVTFLE